MALTFTKLADWGHKTIVSGLIGLSILGLIGGGQAYYYRRKYINEMIAKDAHQKELEQQTPSS